MFLGWLIVDKIFYEIVEKLQFVLWWLSKIVYKLIPDVYAIFEFFAKQKFFTMTELANFWNNLYIVMSVLVLFAIGVKLISAIVNPDILDGKQNGKKKTAKTAFFDAIIAVFLIIIIPMIFTTLNTLQSELIESKFIQKYIFGISFTNESQSNTGQILAYQTISSFLYPCANLSGDDKGKCNDPDGTIGQNQMNALSWNINYIDTQIHVEDLISAEKWDGTFHKNTLKYNYILGLAGGILVLYQLILMTLDMALRTAKIGLLELMLPIILGAFIFDREILIKWVKEFVATYLSAFLKLIAVTMMVLGLSRINPLFEEFGKSNKELVDNALAIGLLRILLLMGILRLVKEVPNLINKIFGVNIQLQGGIKGRLGQMAGVGGLASRAWDTLTKHPIQTTKRLVSAPLSAVGGAVSHGAAAFNRARGQWQNGQRGAALRTGIGGFLGSFGAAVRSGRQGAKDGNLQSIGQAYNDYQNRHLNDSTFMGRTADTITAGLGFGTREERQQERDKLIEHNDPITGRRRRMTFEELQARQNVNKGFDDQRAAIRSQIETSIDRESSRVQINDATGHGIHFATDSGLRTLTGNAASIRKQIDAMENASAAELGVADADEKARLISGLNAAYAAARNNTLDASENLIWQNGTGATYAGGNILATGADMAIVNNALDHATDLINDNNDLRTILGMAHTDAAGNITTSAVTTAGGQVRITDFRAGGRLTVTDEYNAINRDVNRHNDEIAARQSTNAGREQHASGQSVRNAHPKGGGNAGGSH